MGFTFSILLHELSILINGVEHHDGLYSLSLCSIHDHTTSLAKWLMPLSLQYLLSK